MVGSAVLGIAVLTLLWASPSAFPQENKTKKHQETDRQNLSAVSHSTFMSGNISQLVLSTRGYPCSCPRCSRLTAWLFPDVVPSSPLQE